MGRRSPQSKQDKRAKQKAKRKLVFKDKGHESNSDSGETVFPSNDSTDIQSDSTDKDVLTEDSCLGEDIDVVEMNLEDALLELDEGHTEYSQQYLLECRQRLVHKVKHYRAALEEHQSEIAQLKYKHHQEIARIREFYMKLAYAPTRSGRMVKASLISSSVAAEIMKELGLQHTANHRYAK